MTVRNRIDNHFEAWGRFVHRRRIPVLIVCVAVVGTFASFLPQMRTENSTSSYLHSDDPAARVYESFQREFGQDSQILLAIEPPSIFDAGFLEKLQALHDDIEAEVPHVNDVTSLVNARETRGDGDTLVVGELLEDWQAGTSDLAALRQRVFANPLYVDYLISRDGRFTTVTIEPTVYSGEGDDVLDALAGFDEVEIEGGAKPLAFLSQEEKIELVRALNGVIDRYDAPDFRIFAVGGLILSAQMTERMSEDVRTYMAIAASAIALLLFLLFRRFSGVVFPLIVVAASLVGNLGTMVWLDIPFSMSLGMLPVFTMCVGICNTVHVLVLVYSSLGRGDSREDAIAYAFGHSGLAILLTCLTTAAGMLSFLTAELVPIQHLGMTAPFGVLYAYLFSMTLLPALIGVMPPRRSLGDKQSGFAWAERMLVWTGDLATGHPVRTLVVGGALLLLSLGGVTRLHFVHNPISWFADGEPVVRAFEILDEHLGGAMTTEIQIDTGRENGLHDPDVLRRIDAAMRAAEQIEHGPISVGKAISLVDIVKETHQALNANDSDFYAIPETRSLAAQELLLFENSGSDDLEAMTNSRFSIARLTLRVPMVDGTAYKGFAEKIEATLAPILGEDISLTVTGQTVLQARTFTALIESMARSYMVALLIITPLMIVLIGDLRLGLVSMVPNLLPIVMTLGLMGLIGIDIDASNVVIGSVIIGLAVDDTIHFLHRFRREFAITGNSRLAVRATMTTTGSALFFTSLVLATGFTVMGSLGSLKNTVQFGLLSTFGITVAFLADALLTPALVSLVARSSKRRPEELRVSGAGDIDAGAAVPGAANS